MSKHDIPYCARCWASFPVNQLEANRLPAPGGGLQLVAEGAHSSGNTSPAGALGLGAASPRRGPRDGRKVRPDQAPHTEGMGPFGLSGCGGKHQCPLAAHPTESEPLAGPRALCIALAAGGLFWALVVIAWRRR